MLLSTSLYLDSWIDWPSGQKNEARSVRSLLVKQIYDNTDF